MAQNIFKGPSSYEEEDKEFFLGREEETKDLLYLVEYNDFSVCYAESGEGKTSLINAGLTPLLKEHHFLPVNIRFDFSRKEKFQDSVSDYLDEYIWNKIKKTVDGVQNQTGNISNLVIFDDDDKVRETLWWKLRANELRFNSTETITPVLIFDQFEEVFTLAKDTNWIFDFFSWLENLYIDEHPQTGKIFPKRFKVLLSLRSEYVSELDYWSMNKFFIPSLKNNRYCLKPLMKKPSLEIAQQLVELPQGIAHEDIIKYAKTERSGEWGNIKEGLPCVSALVLSLILTALAEKDKDVEEMLDNLQQSDEDNGGKVFFDFLLEHIYEKTLIECYINDDKETQDFIEALETSLVDTNGRRRNISEKDLPSISDKKKETILKILAKGRIINIIDHHYEISHDSLCKVINKRNYERQRKKEIELAKAKEEAVKLKNQREEFIATTLLFPLSLLVIFFLSGIFQDKEVLINLKDTIYYILANLANFSILSILIYSSIKKLKITSWLSIYGVISNVILSFCFLHDQKEVMGLRWGLAVISISVPVIAFIYSFKSKLFGNPSKRDFCTIGASIPLLMFFWIVAGYVFYLCVFNKVLGLREPFNSSWGIFVIPMLTHEIIRNSFGHKKKIIAFVVLCFLLGLLTFNTSIVPFALPSYVLICVICATLGVIIWSFRGLTWGKKTIAIATDILVLTLVVILNMGFNVFKVKYDSVSHVFNWVDVMVHNQENQVGIVSSCTGETIIPCVCDSIDYRQFFCYFSSERLSYDKDAECVYAALHSNNDSIKMENVLNSNALHSYNKEKGTSLWKCSFIDQVENVILKYKSSTPDSLRALREYGKSMLQTKQDTLRALREDSIRVCAARVYHEVSNANVNYFISGKMYSLNDVKSIDTLIVLQMREFTDILNEMYNSTSETKSTPLGISQVAAFNKAFSRSFYLLMLKDRIQQKDSKIILDLPRDMLSLYYFYETGGIDNTDFINIGINITVDTVSIKKNFSFTVKTASLRNNMLDSWYSYVIKYLYMDMKLNGEDFFNHIINQHTDILVNMDSFLDDMTLKSKQRSYKMAELLNKGKKNNNLNEALNSYNEALNIYNEYLDYSNEIKEQINTQIDSLGHGKKRIDLDFQRLINAVFRTLSHIVINSQNIYDSEFVAICEDLYLISVLRQYKIAPIYLQLLEQMDNAKNPLYREFKNFQKQVDREIRNLQRQLDSLEKKVKGYRF